MVKTAHHNLKSMKLNNGFVHMFLSSDIDDCASQPCQSGGTCLDEVNGYSCTSPDCVTGTHCGQGNTMWRKTVF